jgi:2-oxoisovalerate dehydrogenase E2 component (dihydrolipoyl transacylase)
MGGITSTPVINRPEVAIIAVNKVEEKIVPIDGEIEIRKRMNLSLSCDTAWSTDGMRRASCRL